VDTIIMTTGSWQPNYVNQVMQAMKGVEKPIVFVTTQGLRIMMEEPRPVKGVAIYDDGRRAVRAIAKMVQYRRYRSGQQV
jgi:acyl-CoA synthetase (NDP forming)